jgi:hypothetical protein
MLFLMLSGDVSISDNGYRYLPNMNTRGGL